MGIGEQTSYRWKKPYGGVGVAEVRRLKPALDLALRHWKIGQPAHVIEVLPV